VKVKPMLGDWEIPHIESIGSLERRELVELEVPGRAASLYQDLNAAPTRVVISGSLYGDEDRDSFLENVRGKFTAGEPVTFVADIVTATEVQYVLIDTLRFEQSAQRPDEISYLIAIRESPPPPPPPNPLGALDTSLLDQAGGFMDTVTGALDAIETLGSVPDFGNPLPPLQGSLGDLTNVTAGLGETVGGLRSLLGVGEADE
jgi:hypothetical protein